MAYTYINIILGGIRLKLNAGIIVPPCQAILSSRQRLPAAASIATKRSKNAVAADHFSQSQKVRIYSQ